MLGGINLALPSIENESNNYVSIESFDESLLEEEVKKLECLKEENAIKPENAGIELVGGKYEIIEGNPGSLVKQDVLMTAVKDAIDNGQTEPLERSGTQAGPLFWPSGSQGLWPRSGEGEGHWKRPSASRGHLNAAKMTPALQIAACSCQTRVKVRGVHLPQTQQ